MRRPYWPVVPFGQGVAPIGTAVYCGVGVAPTPSQPARLRALATAKAASTALTGRDGGTGAPAATVLVRAASATVASQSSRRTTGYRSSFTASRKPAPIQNSGRAAGVESSLARTSGYASTAAKPRPARSRQTSSTSRSAWPPRRASLVVAMQVMTAGSGASGSCEYSSSGAAPAGMRSGPNWQ